MAVSTFITPAPGPSGPPLDQPISFTVDSGVNIESVALSVRYLRDPLTYVIFETDVFTPPYEPDSSVAGLGTVQVTFTIFEFGGWRGDILTLEAFGIEAGGALFVLPLWNHLT